MRTVSWRILAFLLPLTAYCQGAGTSTITVGVGGGFPAGGYLTDSFSNGSSFSGNFEFRLHQYAAVEVGVENFLADFQNFSRGGEFTTRERVTFLPLGLRGVLPLGQGRIELFLGGGGARVWHTASDLQYFGNDWLWQTNAGGRIALDAGRHFWAGTTLRFYRDVGRPTQEWVSVAGNLSYSFGR